MAIGRMKNHQKSILVTGATGLIGRYLLRELLSRDHEVCVLVRDAAGESAVERVASIVDAAAVALGRRLPTPIVLAGNLTCPRLGLDASEWRWLARNCRTVLHGAATVSYQPTPDGEPFKTNALGTRSLIEVCKALSIEELHHISTAFVCGDRRGLVRETELDAGGGSNNAYEQSKFAGEQFVRQAPGIRATIYRPSVVVGDSITGYTSTYHHFYRFLELAFRLSKSSRDANPERRLTVRLPLFGNERQNLIPVDWVARAIVRLVERPRWHGRTFHLVARQPTYLEDIKAIYQELLHLDGITFVGSEGIVDPSLLERMVLDQFRDYWSYLERDLEFDCQNTRSALPDLPPPLFDRNMAARLLAFAVRDQWGRRNPRADMDGRGRFTPKRGCADYLEQFLPAKIRFFSLAGSMPFDFVFALHIHGIDGGDWTCHWARGAVQVQKGRDSRSAFTVHTNAETFVDMVRGRKPIQDAFATGLMEIEGDMERALKLTVLFEQFIAEFPYSTTAKKALHAVA